jgi:putative transposase
VPSRVSPTDGIRAEIHAVFGSGRDLAEMIEDVARLGARLLIQTAVEAEVDEFLGRARYERRADVPDARPGSLNGFCPTTVRTSTGTASPNEPSTAAGI